MSGESPQLRFPRVRPLQRALAQWFFLGCCALLLNACSSVNSGLALPKANNGPMPVNAPRELSAPERAFWDRLNQARVIYIGETHTSDTDHAYQFDVLKGLKSRGTDLAIGWEMFDVTQQPLLDQWNARQISTEALLDKTNWNHSWGSQSVMYETMLRWSQSESIPSVALNAPRTLSRKLATSQPLTSEERAMTPTGFRPLPGGLEHFTEQMGRHPHAGSVNMDDLYKAQLLWEQTMASRIVDYLDKHPSSKIIVLTGRGHLEGGFGIPAFVRQKSSAKQIVLFPGGNAERESSGRLASASGSRRAAQDRARLTFNFLIQPDASARRH
jgi:uncharacterized iron-regulated protein